MHVPRATTSSETILDNYGVYLLARLRADPQARALAPAFERAVDALRRAHARVRGQHTRLKEAQAARDHADYAAVRALKLVELAVRSRENGNRDAAGYRRVFPRALTPMAEAPPEAMIQCLRGVELAVAGAPRDSDVARAARAMVAARVELEKRVAAMGNARVGLERARGAERTERAHWQSAYRVAHARLTQLFPLEPRKVETFFHAGPKRAASRA